MNMYDIYIPELGTYVKFKVMQPNDIEAFIEGIADADETTFKKTVLENFVFNMRTEVFDALKKCEPETSETILHALYNACVALNPGLDIDTWVSIAFLATLPNAPPKDEGTPDTDFPEGMAEIESGVAAYDYKEVKPFKLSKAKYLNLDKCLRGNVIGQGEAIEAVENVLKRSQAGLNDPGRPLGVLLFAGSSGTGKTHLARTLHEYLFGKDHDLIRIDCGEFQHKHENQKLLGSPPGYLGHGKGGVLTNAVKENPNSVVLLDEVEKAHPDFWHTFLRVFDEGLITDGNGTVITLRNTVIIMTTNLGNEKVVEMQTSKGTGFASRIHTIHRSIEPPARDLVVRETMDAIKKHFKPEFLNRIDDRLVFNHLSFEDFKHIADLEMQVIDAKLSRKSIRLAYDESVLESLVDLGVDAVRGARGMSRVRRDMIENTIADVILAQRIPKGTLFDLTHGDEGYHVEMTKPVKKAKSAN